MPKRLRRKEGKGRPRYCVPVQKICLKMRKKGLTYRAIGKALGIDAKTVWRHVNKYVDQTDLSYEDSI